MLKEAPVHGFALVLDVQPGRADLESELAYLGPFFIEPDVTRHSSPSSTWAKVSGQDDGHMHANDINTAIKTLILVRERDLPPKVLVAHQFTAGMLPDKEKFRVRPRVDLALVMDGFGSRALKLARYRAVMRQFALPFAGFKLFYRQDTNLFAPADVMRLAPIPSVCHISSSSSGSTARADPVCTIGSAPSRVTQAKVSTKRNLGRAGQGWVYKAQVQIFFFRLRGRFPDWVRKLRSKSPCLGEPWGGIYAR